ncbi:hypothetical protein BCR33DRAFT_717542 [Rhizoclosmatium globosum]|uniref:Uncharacterized protein n=1 Tax=Rhizoclosmatium globosum TaxID=329046 RepID=A0A1Y2C8W3_9FUNG|nr:hypothetical protein BCR33DRAFT_717542 [Rhizoclosmatium globosum]|eukprot:ORY43304.1 hypothetical protein BCR33DRAFT_717542 [Rhizoclosmatium globosum]
MARPPPPLIDLTASPPLFPTSTPFPDSNGQAYRHGLATRTEQSATCDNFNRALERTLDIRKAASNQSQDVKGKGRLLNTNETIEAESDDEEFGAEFSDDDDKTPYVASSSSSSRPMESTRNDVKAQSLNAGYDWMKTQESNRASAQRDASNNRSQMPTIASRRQSTEYPPSLFKSPLSDKPYCKFCNRSFAYGIEICSECTRSLAPMSSTTGTTQPESRSIAVPARKNRQTITIDEYGTIGLAQTMCLQLHHTLETSSSSASTSSATKSSSRIAKMQQAAADLKAETELAEKIAREKRSMSQAAFNRLQHERELEKEREWAADAPNRARAERAKRAQELDEKREARAAEAERVRVEEEPERVRKKTEQERRFHEAEAKRRAATDAARQAAHTNLQHHLLRMNVIDRSIAGRSAPNVLPSNVVQQRLQQRQLALQIQAEHTSFLRKLATGMSRDEKIAFQTHISEWYEQHPEFDNAFRTMQNPDLPEAYQNLFAQRTREELERLKQEATRFALMIKQNSVAARKQQTPQYHPTVSSASAAFPHASGSPSRKTMADFFKPVASPARGSSSLSFSTSAGRPVLHEDNPDDNCPICGTKLTVMPKPEEERHLRICLGDEEPSPKKVSEKMKGVGGGGGGGSSVVIQEAVSRPPKVIGNQIVLSKCKKESDKECTICYCEFEIGETIGTMNCFCKKAVCCPTHTND